MFISPRLREDGRNPDWRDSRNQILEESEHEIANHTTTKIKPGKGDRLGLPAADGNDAGPGEPGLSDPGSGQFPLYPTKGSLHNSHDDADHAHHCLHACHPDRPVPIPAGDAQGPLAQGTSLAGADVPSERSVRRAEWAVHGAV